MTDLEKIKDLLFSPVEENNTLGLSMAIGLGMSFSDCLSLYAKELEKMDNNRIKYGHRFVAYFYSNGIKITTSCISFVWRTINGKDWLDVGSGHPHSSFSCHRDKFINDIKPIMLEKYNELRNY